MAGLMCHLATYQDVSPRFVTQPSDRVMVEGETVILFCAANGRNQSGGQPTVAWLKDGAALDLT